MFLRRFCHADYKLNIMKNIVLLIVLICTLITACKKDNSTVIPQNKEVATAGPGCNC